MKLRPLLALIAMVTAGAPAAGQVGPEATKTYGSADPSRALLIRGTTDIGPFGPVLALFAETALDLRITYEQWASNDLYTRAAAACAGTAGSADLLISSSVDQIVKLVNDGCARPHRSVATEALPEDLNWRDEVFGITAEPAVIVYNQRLVPEAEAPKTRFDLIDLLRPVGSRYLGRVATYDIEASGLGYLFAFVDSLQATTFGSLMEAFGRSGAVATCCSAEIIDGVASGDYLIAYNVLGSYALLRAADDPDLAVVAPQDYTLLLSRAAMIPRSAENHGDAAALVDFLLSEFGRRALAQSRLLLEDDGAVFRPAEEDDTVLRRIPLSPMLLVGLDQEKRARFLDLWRATFPDR